MKLENTINEAVFISPKTYGYIDSNNIEHLKIKGFNSDNIKYNQLKSLLHKDNVLKINTQMFKRYKLKLSLVIINKLLTSTIELKRRGIYSNNM